MNCLFPRLYLMLQNLINREGGQDLPYSFLRYATIRGTPATRQHKMRYARHDCLPFCLPHPSVFRRIPAGCRLFPDDFSFLLAADTFAHGRLANPTPAMWTHFESIHITMQPTYMSMYFPAQGLLLAAGKVLFGNPWFGILLSAR
jgi:hypothetical protein